MDGVSELLMKEIANGSNRVIIVVSSSLAFA